MVSGLFHISDYQLSFLCYHLGLCILSKFGVFYQILVYFINNFLGLC